MKTPLWFPQSFFARTLWLVLIVVLFSKALTLVYLLMNEDVLVDRQYSHGVALTLRAYWAADEENRDKIAEAAGLIRVTGSGVPEGEQHWPYSEIYQRQMQAELGDDTEVRLRIHAPPALWVNAPSLGPGWLKVPLYPHPLRGQKIWNVLGWFLAIGLLSTASAWIFVRQLNQPLKRLVFAARQLGQGRSVRLPISDTPSEMTEVYKAFNQMAEDVEQAGRERELMLAGVSHDLRTPLTRLRLSLELMGGHNDLTDDMVRDIEDMDAILDQFLAFIRDGRDEVVEEVDLTDLVREVVARYRAEASEGLGLLERQLADPLKELTAYADYWSSCIRGGKSSFCIAAMLAAELPTIPLEVASEVRGHFADLAAWLASTLERGVASGQFHLTQSPALEAQVFMSSVYGAMLAARGLDDPDAFESVVRASIGRLTSGH